MDQNHGHVEVTQHVYIFFEPISPPHGEASRTADLLSFKSLYQAFLNYVTQQFLEKGKDTVVRALLSREMRPINKM